MTRRKRSGCERDALTRPCPTCEAEAGDWCFLVWDGARWGAEAPALHLSRHDILTTTEAGRFLGVGYLTVTRAVRAGELVGWQDPWNDRWTVDARSVEAFLERMTVEATA